jgi:hypothetical protein
VSITGVNTRLIEAVPERLGGPHRAIARRM